VSCVDHALKHQVPDCRAQGLAAPPRHDGVVLRYKESRGYKGIANEVDRRHAMTEEQTDNLYRHCSTVGRFEEAFGMFEELSLAEAEALAAWLRSVPAADRLVRIRALPEVESKLERWRRAHRARVRRWREKARTAGGGEPAAATKDDEAILGRLPS
jgi:hypothetical protein